MNGLDGKHLIVQAIIEPTLHRYDDQKLERCYCNEMPDDMKLSGYFQGQVNLDTGNMAGYYCNAEAKVTFETPLSTQISDDEKSLLDQRIWDHAQVPPLNNQEQTYRDNQGYSTLKMTRSHPENSEERPNILQIPHLTHPTSQIQLQDDPYQLKNENEIITDKYDELRRLF